MVRQLPQLILARVRFALAHPQPLPLAALLLMVTAAVLHFRVIPTHEREIESAERRTAVAERASRRLAGEQRQQAVSPEEARARLLARFTEETSLNTTLGSLVDLARTHNLDLASGDYRLTATKEGLLAHYVVTLPLKGAYQDLRRYLLGVREAHPSVAVDDIALRRDSIGNPALEAQVRLVVFARRGS